MASIALQTEEADERRSRPTPPAEAAASSGVGVGRLVLPSLLLGSESEGGSKQRDEAAAAADDDSPEDDEFVEDNEGSKLGFQSYWDASYAEDLANFHEYGHAGEIWFGLDVMDKVAVWTKDLCAHLSQGGTILGEGDSHNQSMEYEDLTSLSVLDVGTGNGLLLQALARHGFSDLTGTDYSEGAIKLARSLAARDGFANIKYLVDDVLDTKLDRKFKIIMDKGTLDAIGLHPEGPTKRIIYWNTMLNLIEPGGLVIITSCNNTKDELLNELENINRRNGDGMIRSSGDMPGRLQLQYLDHVRTYPTIKFCGVEGSRVCTIAFLAA